MLLDAGANVECCPGHLVQFAVMGHVYAKALLKIDSLRVGLTTIGEGDLKGGALTREAYRVLKESRLIRGSNERINEGIRGLASVGQQA